MNTKNRCDFVGTWKCTLGIDFDELYSVCAKYVIYVCVCVCGMNEIPMHTVYGLATFWNALKECLRFKYWV